MKIKIWYCMIDCGDGSYTRENFRTHEEALGCEQAELEAVGHVPCDAVDYEIIDTDGYEVVSDG